MILTSKASSCIRMVQWRITLPGVSTNQDNYMNDEDCVLLLADGTMIDIGCDVESFVFCKGSAESLV